MDKTKSPLPRSAHSNYPSLAITRGEKINEITLQARAKKYRSIQPSLVCWTANLNRLFNISLRPFILVLLPTSGHLLSESVLFLFRWLIKTSNIYQFELFLFRWLIKTSNIYQFEWNNVKTKSCAFRKFQVDWVSGRTDMTFAVDWALKNNSLSIFLSSLRGVGVGRL